MSKWLNDMLAVLEFLPAQFTTEDVYAYKDKLAKFHPENRNIEAKIRQQLQVLRDKGFIEFTGRGSYRRIRA